MTILISLIVLMMLSPLQFASAEENYSDLYISVGDAIMKVKAEDWDSAEKLVAQLSSDWEKADVPENETSKKVGDSISTLDELVKERKKEPVLDALSDVSHSLVALEKEQNPVDQEEQRGQVKAALTPILDEMGQSIEAKDADRAYESYQSFLSAWTKNEKIVRSQSIPFYGKIETQMGFLRIALTKDEKDFSKIEGIYGELNSAVENFAAGKNLKSDNQNYSLDTLVSLLEKANQSIDDGNPEGAVPHLEKFLSVWPSVEGDVRTKNGSLYTELENNIPVLAGKLSSENADVDAIQSDLTNYQKSIVLLQDKTNYSVWDAALIMLREGLEALLVVTALLAFLRKANAASQQKWIWAGVIAGVGMSVVAAFILSTVFSTATAGANREIFEGITGIVAVLMMVGVGMWLHQKSTMKAWNQYIQKQMGTALSTGSVLSLAIVSFLSIFREGAETIIFYMGIAPSISTGKMLAGILIAVGILVVCAFVFIRYSTKIPVRPFFKIATFLIYFVAFKILGVSIHALQLTDKIQSTQLNSLPIVDWAGFYPTLETMIPQIVLLLVFAVTAVKIEKGDRKQENRAA
ncbi:FTR1 family iron permease [Lysinibacillus sphaericus]